MPQVFSHPSQNSMDKGALIIIEWNLFHVQQQKNATHGLGWGSIDATITRERCRASGRLTVND